LLERAGAGEAQRAALPGRAAWGAPPAGTLAPFICTRVAHLQAPGSSATRALTTMPARRPHHKAPQPRLCEDHDGFGCSLGGDHRGRDAPDCRGTPGGPARGAAPAARPPGTGSRAPARARPAAQRAGTPRSRRPRAPRQPPRRPVAPPPRRLPPQQLCRSPFMLSVIAPCRATTRSQGVAARECEPALHDGRSASRLVMFGSHDIPPGSVHDHS